MNILNFKNLISIKCMACALVKKPPVTLAGNWLLLPRNSQLAMGYSNSHTIKTPTNRSKTFKPATVPVTNANKHLIIDLADQNGQEIGKVNMERAKELAEQGGLKLVIVDDVCSPPKFKLMTGKELTQMQIRQKEVNRGDAKELREKEIDINLGISEHDLDIKLKMANNFFDKGHRIKIRVLSKIYKKREKNIPKLQEEFVKTLEKLITFTKIKVEKHTENEVVILIEPSGAKKDVKT